MGTLLTSTPDEKAPYTRRGRRPVFAGIDLGTNNCRMLLGTPSAQGFHVLDSFSRVVRLGEGLYETGRLSPVAMERAIASLQICAERAQRWADSNGAGAGIRLRAIATEACRQAENGADFIAAARAATGLPLEIINAREEAELAVESCAPLIGKTVRRALLFDIGGGSTEIAWVRVQPGESPVLIGYLSLPIGVVTLSERCASSCYSPAGFSRLVDDIAAMLRPFEAVHRIGEEIRRGGVQMLGTSGTVTTLAGVSLKLDRYRRGLVDGVALNREAVDAALTEARALGREGLSRHPCIGAERVDYVLPGCAIFAAIHELWQVPELIVADRGLREGMLMRLIRATPAHRRSYHA
jgi:exopolyphosphatase/guanosine-5'-triphosphate,3'-diphosphate pyrophosphatase